MLQPVASRTISVVWCVIVFPFASHSMRTNLHKTTRNPNDSGGGWLSGLSSWGNKGLELGRTGLNMAGTAIKDHIPAGQYECKQDTPLGLLDRWISVTPDTHVTTKLKNWTSLTHWQERIETALDLADHERPELPFDPYNLRSRSAYTDKLLAKTMTYFPQECTHLYKANCKDELLEIIKTTSCAMIDDGKPTTEAIAVGSFNKQLQLCSETIEPGVFSNGSKQHVIVSEEGHILPDGNCVVISTLDPSKGVDLTPLDADLMGTGFKKLASDLTKMQRLKRNVERELTGIVNGLVDKAEQVVEAGSDVVTVVQEFDTDMKRGSEEASEKSAKWFQRLAISTEVDTCLCCDQLHVETHDTMAEHCMVAYTLGGEDKNQSVKHTMKTIAGSLYNLVNTAGNWLVPFIGSNIVSQGHGAACQYVCDLRKPHLYEPYSHGHVRKVPGLAMQTWFIPNPRSFYSSATSGATAAVAQGTATSVVAEAL